MGVKQFLLFFFVYSPKATTYTTAYDTTKPDLKMSIINIQYLVYIISEN